MEAASSSSATWSKLRRGVKWALGQIIEAELDCRIA
jgi:hypothetical protein